MTPMERPEKFADREFLTESEVAALEAEAIAEPGRNARAERGSHVDVEGAYNDVFTHRRTNVVKTKRTSLVIDPPNGKIKRDEKKNEIFESACHEGNYSMTGILAGARALEKEKPAATRGSR